MNNPLAGDKRRLIAALSLLLSLGFIVTSFTSYFVSRNTIRQSILEDELPLTADNIYSEIQKDLVRPTFISSMMASDTFLRDWILNGERDVAQISKYLQEVKTRLRRLRQLFRLRAHAQLLLCPGHPEADQPGRRARRLVLPRARHVAAL